LRHELDIAADARADFGYGAAGGSFFFVRVVTNTSLPPTPGRLEAK
jgi:hypothetical protein